MLVYYLWFKQYHELIESKLQIITNEISADIVQAHMQNKTIKFNKYILDDGYEYGLYKSDKSAIYTMLKEKIDFSKKVYKNKNSIFYINNNTSGHLDVSYVVVKKVDHHSQVNLFKYKVIFITVFIYLIIAIIGIFLAKLFITPIQSQRDKLNDFIKDTTHELNTPVSALLLCVENDDYYSEQNREYIKISAKKISNIYKDLTYLLFKSSCNIDENEISKVLEEELSFHKKVALKKDIIVNATIKKSSLNINEDDFLRLTNNIISNSIKYTKRGGNIDIFLDDKRFIVEDNGIGIEKDKLNKIFERYFRATDIVGGFGVGLNIVSSICKKYNFKIDIKSELNKGTIFSIEF